MLRLEASRGADQVFLFFFLIKVTDIHIFLGWSLSVLIPVAMQFLIGDFS